MKVLIPYRDVLTPLWLEHFFKDVTLTSELNNDVNLVVLIGGTDINSKLYGHEPNSHNDKPNIFRDYEELRILRSFKGPVLGICRGFQMLHVFHGGKLNQHVTNHLTGHDILAKTDNGYKQLFHAPANHHQQVTNPDGEILATSPEGDIESVLWNDKHLGVQWHPEWSKNFNDLNSVWTYEKLSKLL